MRLGIVSPCYNEEEVLGSSAARLDGLLDDLILRGKVSADSFVMFVSDGSDDGTWDIISALHTGNPARFKALKFSRNFGHQSAIMAGMMSSRSISDAVITIDADLQDDLGAIEAMVDKFGQGYDIVYGVKVSRQADSFLKRTSAITFYKLQKSMGIDIVANHADFRLLSRKALDQLSQFKEKNLYLRGIIPSLGYRSATVDDVISERTGGVSKYSMSKMLGLAADGITSFSTKPIKLIFGAGVFFLILSFIAFLYVIASFVEHNTIPGWTSLMLSLWFISSIILFSIGVIGLYIGKIYVEIKDRPLYHIDEELL